jgi:ketosteroid isomerase-like protein
MAVSTAVDFKAEVRKLFDRFDRQEFDEIQGMFAADAQGVDEISRKWMRGKAPLDRYFRTLEDVGVADIHSNLRDFETKIWDDIALVTCILEQSYTIAGEQIEITSPLSVLYKRHRGDWKIELVHAVPLPDVD